MPPKHPKSSYSFHGFKFSKARSTTSVSWGLSFPPHDGPSDGVEGDLCQELPLLENTDKTVWKAVKSRGETSGSKSMIVAVVRPECEDRMKDLIKNKLKAIERKTPKGDHKRITARVVIATPKTLHNLISGDDSQNFHALNILVCSSIPSVEYKIPASFRTVIVGPCGPTGDPSQLKIASSSTFCGVEAFAWDYRQDLKLRTKYRLRHEDGCTFDLGDTPGGLQALHSRILAKSELSSEDARRLKRQFDTFRDEFIQEGKTPLTDKRPRVSPTDKDGKVPAGIDTLPGWFQRWKTTVALVLGAGAGAAVGAFAIVFANCAGIYVKGPLGASVAAGRFHLAFVGGAAATALVAAAAWASTAYFVPWDRAYPFVRSKLWRIWDWICDVVGWVWDKTKATMAAVASCMACRPRRIPRCSPMFA